MVDARLVIWLAIPTKRCWKEVCWTNLARVLGGSMSETDDRGSGVTRQEPYSQATSKSDLLAAHLPGQEPLPSMFRPIAAFREGNHSEAGIHAGLWSCSKCTRGDCSTALQASALGYSKAGAGAEDGRTLHRDIVDVGDLPAYIVSKSFPGEETVQCRRGRNSPVPTHFLIWNEGGVFALWNVIFWACHPGLFVCFFVRFGHYI